MTVSQLCNLSSSGSPFDESFLDKERLVHFLHGSTILTNSRSNGTYTDRTTTKLIYNGKKYLIVNFIQAILVYIKCFKCNLSYLQINTSIAFYLREVTHTSEQSICNTGRSTAPARYLPRSLCVYGKS